MHFYKKINPAVAMVINGIDTVCTNEKTGDMITQWFLRSDMHPCNAHESGADRAVCFDCPLRETNTCYVSGNKRSLAWQIAAIYRALTNGRYADLPAVQDIAGLIRRKPFRFGGYGEPVLFDFDQSVKIAQLAPAHCGYTHAWRWCNPQWSRLLMASVETLAQRNQAHAKGYRTARIIHDVSELQPGEVLCDHQRTKAAIKDGKKCRLIQCATCGRCSGTFRRGKKYQTDVCFIVHGGGAKNFDHAVELSETRYS